MALFFMTAQQDSAGFNIFLIALPIILFVLIVARLVWYFLQRRKK